MDNDDDDDNMPASVMSPECPHARMIDLICDLATADTSEHNRPNEADTIQDFAQRARDILSVMDAEDVLKKWNPSRGQEPGKLPEPSAWDNARYNVSDMWGKPIPDEVVRGEQAKAATLGLNYGRDVTQRVTWDYADEDGDVHSPAWYLEAFVDCSRNYGEALSKNIDLMTPEQEIAHMGQLDDLLAEKDIYERYVNRLFGYSHE